MHMNHSRSLHNRARWSWRHLALNLALGLFATTTACSWVAEARADALDDARAGDAAAENGEFQTAIELYTDSIAEGTLSQHNLAAVYFNRGGVYLETAQPEDAVEDYTQTVLLRPDHDRAWAARGVALRAIGDYENAIGDFTRALEVGSSDDSQIYNLRGQAQTDLGEYELAIADFDTALDLRPIWAFATRNRARAKFYLGAFNDAAIDFEAAFDIERDPYTSLWRFLSLARAGETDDALNFLGNETGRLREQIWPSPIVRMYLGELSPSEVLELTNDPEDPELTAALATEAMFYIGQLFVLQDDNKQAAAFFDRVIELGITHFVEYDGARAELTRIGR